MTAPASSDRTMRLPMWAIALMLVAGLLSVAFAGGSFFTVVALALLVANVVGTFKYFGEEVGRLRTAYVGHGPVDRAALRKDAMSSLSTPLWMVATLAVGSIWTGLVLVEFVGFLIGVIFVLAIVAVVCVAAYYGYKAAKKRGMLD